MWTSTATRYAVRGGIIALPLLRVCSCEEKSFTAEEVSERNGANGRPFWVTYKGAVYDVTKFQAVHPGGNFINQAAGGPVEPFWAKWVTAKPNLNPYDPFPDPNPNPNPNQTNRPFTSRVMPSRLHFEKIKSAP